MIMIGFLSLKWRPNKSNTIIVTYVNKRTERSTRNVAPRFSLSVSEHSCQYYNFLSDRVLFITEISEFLSILLSKFTDWVFIMNKWSNDSLWLMLYGKYFDHEMVEWYYMGNILTLRWSTDFIRHLPYNETWSLVTWTIYWRLHRHALGPGATRILQVISSQSIVYDDSLPQLIEINNK